MQNEQKSTVKARITAVHPHGMAAEVDGQKGFIKKRNISWEDPFVDPLASYAIGELVDAVILGTDPKHDNQLILSMKHFVCNPWKEFLPKFKEAKRRREKLVLEGTVYEILDNRIYIRLSDNTNAVLYQRDLATLHYYKDLPLTQIFKLGDHLRGVAGNVDEARETVEISANEYLSSIATGIKETPPSFVTLGDIFGDKMASAYGLFGTDAEDRMVQDMAVFGRQAKRVLVIDNDLEDALELKEFLAKEKFEAVVQQYDETSGFQGLDGTYDAVFIDKNLGNEEDGQDGITIAKNILEEIGDLPIFIITGESPSIALEKLRQKDFLVKAYLLVKPNWKKEMAEIVEYVLANREERKGLIEKRNARLDFACFRTADQSDNQLILRSLESLCADEPSRKSFLIEFNPISKEMTLFRSYNLNDSDWSGHKSTMRHSPLLNIVVQKHGDIIFTLAEERKKNLPSGLQDIISIAGSPVIVHGEAVYGLFLVDSMRSLSGDDYLRLLEFADRIGFLIERLLFNEHVAGAQRFITTGVFYEFMRHDIIPNIDSLRKFDVLKYWESNKSKMFTNDHAGESARTKFRQRLRAVRDATNSVSELLDSFTSLETHGKEMTFMDVRTGIPELIKTIKRTMIQSTGVDINFRDNTKDHKTILVSGLRFNQVLKNMILNACQQIKMHSLPVKKVTVSLSHEDSDPELPIRIEIADTGPGIHRMDFRKVFMPLYTTRKKGIGLGLFLCQQLTSEMGGKIEIKSSYMLTGSEFRISLPGEVQNQ